MRKLIPFLISLLGVLAMILSMASATELFGQNSGGMPPWFWPAFPNANGSGPVANGFVCTTESGTITPLATYQEPTLTTANQNPIRLNAAGRAVNGGNEVRIYLLPQSYRIAVYGPGSSNTCNSQPVGALIRQVDSVYDVGQLIASGLFVVSELNNRVYCTVGATMGAKITAAVALLPSTGGTVDCSNLEGAQSITTNVFSGVTKPIDLIVGAATVTWSASSSVPSNVNVTVNKGGSFSLSSGVVLTYAGGLTAGRDQVFSGTGTVSFTSVKIKEYYPEWLGAVCDGSTDDAPAFDALPVAMTIGGVISLAPGATCRLTSSSWNLGRSNVVVNGNGAEILYQPTVVAAGNDRAVLVYIANDANLGAAIAVTSGTVAIGATTFTAASTAGLAANDYITMYVIDPMINDVVEFDWAQIASVSGSTVTVINPFRTRFTTGHGTPTFQEVTNPVSNVTVRNLRCRTTDPANGLVCFSASYARNVIFDNVTATNANGNCFYSYRNQGFSITNSRGLKCIIQANELAESVDVVFSGNTIGSFDTPALTSALTLDMGLGFFSVTNNVFQNCGNICMQIVYGVHDGIVANNVFGYVRDAGLGNTLGIASLGTRRVAIQGNVFQGGAGASSIGISLADATLTRVIPTEANILGPNIISNFAARYGTKDNDDLYIETFGSGFFSTFVDLEVQRSSVGTALSFSEIGDTVGRYYVNSRGAIAWSDGTTTDMTLQRISPGLLDTDKDFRYGSGAGTHYLYNDSVAFAALGTPSNGAQVYCSDCTVANPCAGGGTGAFAKRINATWVCD